MGRILIADVEKNYGIFLKQELEDEGYFVDLILRRETTTSRITGRPAYDIVLLDMQMPGLDYYQRLKRIKNNVTVAHVVVFADSAAFDDRTSLLISGADACFSKYDITNLKKHLRQNCERAQNEAGIPIAEEDAAIVSR